MPKPKLIVLNGFAGSGKSTIAKSYIAAHPLALMIEGDQLIVNMGDWLDHEAVARDLVCELTKVMALTHLKGGHDVVLPYLVVDHSHIDAFGNVARVCNADFYNVYLRNDKADAISRLLERGTWGEAGLDPIGDKDMPVIESLYSRMQSQLEHQKQIIVIEQAAKTPDQTLAAVIAAIS